MASASWGSGPPLLTQTWHQPAWARVHRSLHKHGISQLGLGSTAPYTNMASASLGSGPPLLTQEWHQPAGTGSTAPYTNMASASWGSGPPLLTHTWHQPAGTGSTAPYTHMASASWDRVNGSLHKNGISLIIPYKRRLTVQVVDAEDSVPKVNV